MDTCGNVDLELRIGRDTPLVLAVSIGDLQIVRTLLDRGAHINLTHQEMPPLHVAASNGNMPVLSELLDRGAAVNMHTVSCGLSPAHYASKKGQVAAVDLLHRRGADLNSETTFSGDTPLHVACANAQLDMVKFLMSREVYVDEPNMERRTPLCVAAASGFTIIVRTLLTKLVQVNHQMRGGATPLFLAAESGHVDVVTELLACRALSGKPNTKGESPLMQAAKNGHVEVVENLLWRGGARIDQIDKSRKTALHWAVLCGRPCVVFVLLDRGANPDLEDENACTSLFHACQEGSILNVKHLLLYRADMEIVAVDHMTPIHVAALNGHVLVVKELIRFFRETQPAHNVDQNLSRHINLLDIDRSSALLVAAQKGYRDILNALLDAGADIDHEPIRGGTPLWHAASKGFELIVNDLLFRGATVNRVCLRLDMTRAIDIAAQRGFKDVVTSLLLAGADITEYDSDYATPLKLALDAGHKDLAVILHNIEQTNISARDGPVSVFIDAIKAGTLSAPSQQWVRSLPATACAELSTWVHGCLTDCRACFVGLLSLRRITEVEGPVSDLISEYLVHKLASTRRILRDLPALITDRTRRIEGGLPVYPP